jgi:microcompartment protein CcmK/EutM
MTAVRAMATGGMLKMLLMLLLPMACECLLILLVLILRAARIARDAAAITLDASFDDNDDEEDTVAADDNGGGVDDDCCDAIATFLPSINCDDCEEFKVDVCDPFVGIVGVGDDDDVIEAAAAAARRLARRASRAIDFGVSIVKSIGDDSVVPPINPCRFRFFFFPIDAVVTVTSKIPSSLSSSLSSSSSSLSPSTITELLPSLPLPLASSNGMR